MISAKWVDAENTTAALTDSETGHVVIVEPWHERWSEIEAIGDSIAPYDQPTKQDERLQMRPLSRRQFFSGLATAGVIEWDEAVSACNKGDAPTIFDRLFAAMGEREAAIAKMRFGTLPTFDRLDPLVVMLQSIGEDDMDAIFATEAGP